MRIPLNWLEKYIKLPEKEGELNNALTFAGHMLDKTDIVNGKTVLDLELRGNRADCYSILGIAREVSALFKTNIKYPPIEKDIKTSPQIKNISLQTKSKYVQRVMMVRLNNVTITKSPSWLKTSLEMYGIPSINNIVDLTNYVMLETGQPMHAFDLANIGKSLEIRLAKKDEKVTTFLGQQISLTDDDLVWANKESVLSIAGAIGGKFHSIKEDTKDVLLEAASYNQANIRRTVHRHNLLTDAGIRHEKELDPNLVEFGIRRFICLLLDNGWGKVKEEIFDYYPKPVKPWRLSLNFGYLETLSGFVIEKRRVKEILQRLNFKILKENKGSIDILCPTYRTDVTREEDIIEEVLRINGYENIPEKILSLEIPNDITPDYIKQELSIKQKLFSLGFDEIITLPFISPNLQKYNKLLTDKASPVTVLNRPSPEIEEMRMTMLPNLVKFTKKIINERGEEVRIFEVGKIYFQKKGDYFEKRSLGISFWSIADNSYRRFKGYLDSSFNLLNIKNIRFTSCDISSIEESSHLILGKGVIGTAGKVDDIYFAEIYLDDILGKQKVDKVDLWPKYPPQIEDLTLEIPNRVLVGDVIVSIRQTSKTVSSVELTDIYKQNYTFRISYQDPTKTLEDSEIKESRDQIIKRLKKTFRITLKN